MKRSLTIAAAALLLASGAASASTIQYGMNAAATSTTLHGGNREMISMGFNSNPTVFNGGNFLNFTDGSLTNNVGTFGWTAPIPRDMNGSNNNSGNPDRADSASAYTGEGGSTGTLAEVFGPFGSGYKNLSYIIDGEDNGSWVLDLLFAPGQTLSADASNSTIELAVLERGRNSDFNIYGITAGRTFTAPVFVPRANVTAAGWTLDTLEIDGAQNVGGVGLSLDSSWTNLIGFRIQSQSAFNGPDIVAIATASPIPAPSSIALLSLGGLFAKRRRR
ncbi:MAG: PEP-CTERM sorting domain-containing protein [Pyrinomonadaceae bacterium]|nr:PEP-CTERM sorting domain-containing protein [Phycisphaerales bacterium]